MSPRVQRQNSPFGLYHVLISGNNNEDIFIDDADKQELITILFEKSETELFDLYAYCVLNNRANFLIRPKQETLSDIMKKINMSYAVYFNKKYMHSGHVFQDRFKSQAVSDESFILPIIGYIHYNPVLEGICEKPEEYPFSSCGEQKRQAEAKCDSCTLVTYDVQPYLYFKLTLYDLHETFYYDHCYANMEEIANRIIEQFMREHKITIQKIRKKEYSSYREALVGLIRKNTGFSIRKISEMLGINRGEIYRIVTRLEDKNDLSDL
jgi:REP element-mobilizing transposase RayT